MIEIAIPAIWAVIWLRPKWSTLNRGGILLFLLAAPQLALTAWFMPEWLRDLATRWLIYFVAFLAVGASLFLVRTRTNPDLARMSRQPADAWFPALFKSLKRLSKAVPVLLLLGSAVGLAAIVFLHSSPSLAAMTAFAVGLAPILPFVYLLLAVKIADYFGRSNRRAT